MQETAAQGEQKHEKLDKLPEDVKIRKRPLLHPPIPSPYAGKQDEKVVYISAKTPFISAVKRVRGLLKQADKRTMQSQLSKSKGRNAVNIATSATATSAEPEEVKLKATGKAIEKTLNLAMFFQRQKDCQVRIKTHSVDAIDDLIPRVSGLVPKEHTEDMQQGVRTSKTLPSARIRHVSVLEVSISLR